jgi:NAD(P)-dependent dehydrogenase (short-subunit alcohol dehydrogenase family)
LGLFDGKTAVNTGGTSGIGLATAGRFIEEGAGVFITGRRQAELDAALAQLAEKATGVQGDVGVGADLDRLYAAVPESGRGCDIVVANARVTAVARIGDITEEALDTLLSTDAKGVVFTVQKALSLLNDDASIILTGSTTAERGRQGALDTLPATNPLAATLWQVTHPPEALALAYAEGRPIPPDWNLEFLPALIRLLTATCAGVKASVGHARTQR